MSEKFTFIACVEVSTLGGKEAAREKLRKVAVAMGGDEVVGVREFECGWDRRLTGLSGIAVRTLDAQRFHA